MLPHARQDKLLVQEVGDELVVYDQQRHRAHSLNRVVALVWQNCDGQKTVADLAALLQKELNQPADEELVWLALDRLGKAHLLRESISPPVLAPGVSRRSLLRAAGILAVPVLVSIASPASAAVVSNCGRGADGKCAGTCINLPGENKSCREFGNLGVCGCIEL